MATNDTLTQDEIDALTASDDSPETDENGEIKLYDFSSQDRTVRARLPALERVYERFVKKLDTSMYDLTSTDVEVSMEEVKAIKYADYMASLPMPTCINMIRISPLHGTMLINLNAELVFILVDNFFGSDGRFDINLENREFTLTELRVVQILLDIVFKDLHEAWAPIIPVEFTLIKNEMNPQLVNVTSGNDIVYVAPFKIGFGGGEGVIDVVLPYGMLNTIREELDMGAQRSEQQIDENWVSALQAEMYFAEVNFTARLIEMKMTVEDVMKFKQGDILPLNMPEHVVALVEDIPTFRATYGASNDKCAIKISHRIDR